MLIRKDAIIDIAAIYILIWTITPAMDTAAIFRVLLIGCSGIWLLAKWSYLRQFRNDVFVMIFLALSYFFVSLFSLGVQRAISITINLIIFMVLALIGLYYTLYDVVALRKMILVVLCVSIVVAIISLRTVIVDPVAMRLATHSGGDNSYGAYGFVYMCVEMTPFLLLIILQLKIKEDLLLKSLCIISFVIACMLVLASGFTWANIILLTGVILVIVFKDFNIKKLFLWSTVFFVLLFFKDAIIKYIFDILLKITNDSVTYSTKIRDLYNQIVLSSGVGSSYSNRVDLYTQSFQAIIKYPFFGSYFIIGESATGGHSTLIDILGNYGLIIAFLYYWLVLMLPVKITKMVANSTKYKAVIFVFLVVVSLNGVFDTLDFSFAWVWYLLLPFTILCSDEERKINDDIGLDNWNSI